jgi:hypothetical protein
MRHRVRLKWQEWEHVGASGQVLNWIHHVVRVKFKTAYVQNHLTTESP